MKMKNRIRSLEDLRLEKRLTKMEIDATEDLIFHSLHLSRENLLHGASEAFFSLLRREPLDISDVTNLFAHHDKEKSGWFQKLLLVLPLVLKVASVVYDSRVRKEPESKAGDITLRKVAS
jgi:hypothetical protein